VPRLTIVIPCPDGGERFENTLISVLQNRPGDCEVLVVYPGPYEDPYELAKEVGFVETPAGTSLVEMINIGFEQAAGEIVHILQCDVQVGDGWCHTVLPHFDEPSLGTVSSLLASESSDVRRLAAGVGYRSSGRRHLRHARRGARRGGVRTPSILGPTLVAGFYRREAVLSAGGFDETIGERYADVDMALTLKQAGYRSTCESGSLVFGDLSVTEPLGFTDARRVERLFWKHAPFHHRLGPILLHALTVAVELLLPFPGPRSIRRLLGRLLGLLDSRRLDRARHAATERNVAPRSSASTRLDTRRRTQRPNRAERAETRRYVA